MKSYLLGCLKPNVPNQPGQPNPQKTLKLGKGEDLK